MESKFRIRRQQLHLTQARSFVSTKDTQFGSRRRRRTVIEPRKPPRTCVALVTSAPLGGRRLEHRHDARVIQIASRNAFEMCADAAQFRSQEAVHKMQAT